MHISRVRVNESPFTHQIAFLPGRKILQYGIVNMFGAVRFLYSLHDITEFILISSGLSRGRTLGYPGGSREESSYIQMKIQESIKVI